MPSLIYIARIWSLSKELARSLRSAGCHVESFKPGDITQDECLLAMTPEAAHAALHPERLRTETGRNYAGAPAPDMSQQIGSDAAVWDCLRAAVAKELRVNQEPVRPAGSTVDTKAMESGFTAAEAARREVSSEPAKVNKLMARIEPPPISAVSPSEVPHYPKKSRLAIGRCRRVFRSPLSTVVAVLVFAVAYRGLLSMTASPGRHADRSTSEFAFSAEPSHRAGQRVQKHVSVDAFMAEDFTNRVALRAPSNATQQNVGLKHPLRASTPKRVVVE